MSKLMWIAGILLAAAGIALGLVVFASAAPPAGITLESALLLLVGGILSLGLGSTISGLEVLARQRSETPYIAPAAAPVTAIPEFGRRNADLPPPPPSPPPSVVPAAVSAAAASGSSRVLNFEEVSEPTRETIQALEQARQKIEQAFEPKSETSAAAPEAEALPEPASVAAAAEPTASEPAAAEEPPAEEEVAEEEALEEGQLYVVEERLIRLRPARILSDGTVEAETDEGWMRFENLEHLDEYLDAMTPAR